MVAAELLRSYVSTRMTISDRTVEQMRIAATGWDRWAEGRPLSSPNLVAHLRAESSRIAPATVDRRRGYLLTLWRHGQETEQLPAEVIRVPKAREPRRQPEAWTMPEFRRLLHAAECVRERPGFGVLTWRAFMLFLYDTGIRLTAALSVSWGNFRCPRVHVPAELQKSNRDHVAAVSDQTAEALRELRGAAGVRMFPWPIRRDGIFRQWRAIVAAAGLPVSRRNGLHKFRRTGYTAVANALGVPAASAWADHAVDLSAAYWDRSAISSVDYVASLPRP